MKRKTAQIMLLSALLAGSAVAVGNYVYAEESADQLRVQPKAVGVPYKPTNLSISVSDIHDDGTADVTLTFTTPTRYWDEDEYGSSSGLDELTSIAIVEGKNVVYTEECTEMGVEMTVVLENVAAGKHTYKVYALNSESSETVTSNSYSYATFDTIKVGYDTPGYVQNIVIENNNPVVVLTWEAPVSGSDGGTFLTEGLCYDVYRYCGNDETELATDLTELTYTDNVSYDEPTTISYGIKAKNVTGEGSVRKSDSIIVGSGYGLPFSESFNKGTAEKKWTSYKSKTEFTVSTYISSSYGVNTGFGSKLYNGYDEDGGALYMKCNSDYYDSDEDPVATLGTYTSSPISLEGAEAPGLSFYQYVIPNSSNKLKSSVIVSVDGEDNIVASYSYEEEDGTAGWVARSIDLSAFAGKEIVLIFKGECTDDQPGFTAYDCITIEEVRGDDLVLNSLTAPASVDSGSEYVVSANVYNKGSNEAKFFTVELYKGEELLDSKEVESLLSGESTDVEFSATADNSYDDVTSFTAKVVFNDDADLSNNEATASMSVRKADAPAVSDLEGQYNDSDIILTWSEPDYILPAVAVVTESFESYAHKATSLDGWTMSKSHSIGVDFEDYGIDEDEMPGSASFVVLDNDSFEYGSSWKGAGHSGTHYLMSAGGYWNTRKDRLTSPLLSGAAQTINFFAGSHNEISDWWSGDVVYDNVKVYASSTTTDNSAFSQVLSEDITTFMSEGYQEFNAELPEGTKYFAIEVTNSADEDGESIIFLDDITFEKGQDGIQATLLGYNVYDGEEKLNEDLITGTSYTVVSPEEGDHSYSVVAVYNVGESDHSNAVNPTKQITGVSSVKASVQVYATRGSIHIGAATADVYDLAGRKLAHTTGNSVLSVSAGTYIVKADNKVFKLFVK